MGLVLTMSYMSNIGSGFILALFLSLSLLSGCSGDTGNANTTNARNTVASRNANAARTNVEELSLLVNVPYEADDIVWKQDAEKRNIIAVFRFSPEEAERAAADAGRAGQGQPVTISAESWFPEELIAQSEVSGDNTLKGTAYPATSFFQDPFNSGRITRIEGVDYFILELSAN
jgi:hypothetical protein